ncbi:aldo/keto reductase, partial [Clostridium perfringens]
IAQEVNIKYGVQLQAWAPFAEGKNGMFDNLTLKSIGDKYDKSLAQVILRWLLQRGIVPLAKTVNKERMKQNIDIFNFELSKDDMNTISALDKKESSFFNHQEASSVEMLASLNR